MIHTLCYALGEIKTKIREGENFRVPKTKYITKMEDLTKLLEKLAEKLGTTTEYLWTVLMKQATIEAYYAMISIGLFILMLIPFYKYARWFSKNYQEIYENDNEILHWFITVVIGIIVIIWFIASVCDIHTIMTALNNPEYWALKQVLKSIR